MALAPFRVLGTGKLRTDAEEQRRRESNEKGRDVFGTGWERSEIEVKMSHALEKVASEVGAKSITSGKLLSFPILIIAIQRLTRTHIDSCHRVRLSKSALRLPDYRRAESPASPRQHRSSRHHTLA